MLLHIFKYIFLSLLQQGTPTIWCLYPLVCFCWDGVFNDSHIGLGVWFWFHKAKGNLLDLCPSMQLHTIVIGHRIFFTEKNLYVCTLLLQHLDKVLKCGIVLHFLYQGAFISRRQNVLPSWAVWRPCGHIAREVGHSVFACIILLVQIDEVPTGI